MSRRGRGASPEAVVPPIAGRGERGRVAPVAAVAAVLALSLAVLGCGQQAPPADGPLGESWRLDASERLAAAQARGDGALEEFWRQVLEERRTLAAGAQGPSEGQALATMLEAQAWRTLESSAMAMGYESHDQMLVRTASAQLEHALALDPASAERQYRAAYAWFLAQDHERARARLENALALDPERAQAWQMLGTMLLNEGQAQAAREPLERVVALAPDDANAHYVLGKCREELGELLAAERSYRRAIELHPGLIEPYNRLGGVLARLGREAGARRVLSWFLWWKRHKVALRGHVATVARGTPELEALHAHLAGLLEAPSGDEAQADARTALADACLLAALGREDQARARLREARRGGEGDPDLLVEAAELWLRLGEPDRALALLGKALAADERHLEAHLALASLCARAGKAQAAREHYRAAAQLAPECEEARLALAEAGDE